MKSKCCGAEVKIYCKPFVMTVYKCLKCNKPCEAMTEEEYINAREDCPERNN